MSVTSFQYRFYHRWSTTVETKPRSAISTFCQPAILFEQSLFLFNYHEELFKSIPSIFGLKLTHSLTGSTLKVHHFGLAARYKSLTARSTFSMRLATCWRGADRGAKERVDLATVATVATIPQKSSIFLGYRRDGCDRCKIDQRKLTNEGKSEWGERRLGFTFYLAGWEMGDVRGSDVKQVTSLISPHSKSSPLNSHTLERIRHDSNTILSSIVSVRFHNLRRDFW
jgi:hypothetical protein